MKERWMVQLGWIALSFCIVAFGQPAWISWLGLVAAILGFALFWKAMLEISKVKWRFWLASSWFTGVQLIQLSWLTSDEYQGYYIWIVWFCLAAIMGLQFGLISLLVRPAPQTDWLRTLAIPSAWVLMEGSRLYIFSGLTWGLVGIELTGSVIPLQMASLWGVYGLSFWVMLTNLLVLRAFHRPERLRSWAAAAAIALVPYLYGTAQYSYHAYQIDRSKSKNLEIALVQTALRPGERIPLGTSDTWVPPYHQWVRILSFLKPYLGERLDLIVLPETVVPYGTYQAFYNLGDVQRAFQELLGCDPDLLPPNESPLVQEVASQRGLILAANNAYFSQGIANCFAADVVAGLEVTDEIPGSEPTSYAAAFHFKPHQKTQARYEKRILLPVAESIPFEWAKPLAAMYGIKGSFEPGAKAEVFNGPVPIGVSICYEETFSYLVREVRALGAQLLVNISNDGWYPQSRLARQHFFHGRLRAIELGLPLVRACNTGVTVALDSIGRNLGMFGAGSPDFESMAGAIRVSVPTYSYGTLYAKLGDGMVFGFSFIALLLFFRYEMARSWRRRGRLV